MTKDTYKTSFYNYNRINSIRTNLLLEEDKELNRHIHETQTKINYRTIKDFERKHQDLIIKLDNEYFNNHNNEINYGKRISNRLLDHNLFRKIIKLHKGGEIDRKNTMNDYKMPVRNLDKYIYDNNYFDKINCDEEIDVEIKLIFNQKENKRFNISDKKNKNFQEYIKKIKNGSNISNSYLKKKKLSEDYSISKCLAEEIGDNNGLIKPINSKTDLQKLHDKNCSQITITNFDSEKYFPKRNSIKSENLSFFNTLNNSNLIFSDLNKTTIFDREKIIERFISKIPNKNTNKFILKKNFNNPLLYKNNKQMKKEIKIQNKKIGFNYIHILTMKLKKISSTSEIKLYENEDEPGKFDSIPDKMNANKINDLNSYIKNFSSNKNTNKELEFSEKLLNLIYNGSNKNSAICNEILRDYPFTNENSSYNLANMSEILRNKESNHLISNFLSYGNFNSLTQFLNQKLENPQDSVTNKSRSQKHIEIFEDISIKVINENQLSKKNNLFGNIKNNLNYESSDFQTHSRKKEMNIINKTIKNDTDNSGSKSSCYKILDYLTDDDESNHFSSLLKEKTSSDSLSSTNNVYPSKDISKKKTEEINNGNCEDQLAYKFEDIENKRKNLMNKNFNSIDTPKKDYKNEEVTDYSFGIDLIPIINYSEENSIVNSTITSSSEFDE